MPSNENMRNVRIHWEHSKDADGTVYDQLAGYEIHHNLPNIESPYICDPTINSSGNIALPEGIYSIGICAVSTEGHKSKKVVKNFQISNSIQNHEVSRNYGIPLGGVMSTNSYITAAGIFKTESGTGWSFASAGTPQQYKSFQNGHANRYSQDCSDIAEENFSIMTDLEAQYKSHYIVFDASDSNDPLKLIKYEDLVYSTTNNLNVGYFYDTDDGNSGESTDLPELTFVTKTGTASVVARSNSVIGTGTSFTTEYAIDDIIYFSSTKAAKVTFIDSNESITIDKVFDTAITNSAIKVQGFTPDKNYDAAIYAVRNDEGTFKILPINLTIDESVFNRSRIATLQAAPNLLNFDNAEVLTTSYTNIVLTATGNGFISPKFKITGTGFNNSEISQSAHDSFQNPNTGTKQFVYELDFVDAFPDPAVDLDFTVTITEASDESNTDLQSTQSITIPFLKVGATTYTWTKYGTNASGAGLTDTYTEGTTTYIGMAFNKTAATESTTAGDYIWSRLEGEDGATYYTWIKYGTSAAGAGLTNTYSAGTTTYVGYAYGKTTATESTIAGDYTWSRLEGVNADNKFTWVKYGTNASGAGLTDTYSAGTTTYIGMAFNKTTATESTTAGDYTWTKIEGEDGVTTYTWVKYGTNASGAGLTDTYTAGTTTYIGMAFNKTTATESITAGDYTWTKIEGEDGDPGDPGAVGKKTATGYLYYNTQQGSPPSPAPSDSGVTYTFSTGVMAGGVIGTGTTNWSLIAPTASGGTAGSKMYYVYWNAEETTTAGGTASPDFGSTVYTATNFTGLVRFDGTNKIEDGLGTGNALSFGSSGTTEIDGAKITTGTVLAAHISITGKSNSDLDNDEGFTDDTVADQKTTASEVNLANKAAGKVGGWTITSSAIQGGQGVYIGGAKTTYASTTAGWWIGQASGSDVAKLNIGDASNYLKWTGTGLDIKGDITLNNASTTNLSTFNNDAVWTNDAVANTKTTLSAANAAVNANVTNISGGVIQTGYLSAARIQAGTITGEKFETDNNTIGSTSNKFAFNGTTEYGVTGYKTVIGATAVGSSTAAALFFSSGGTFALGAQTSTSGQSTALFFNSALIGAETYKNRADLANDLYGSVFQDDSGKYAKLATPTEAGWFQDAASTPNYVKIATGAYALYYVGAIGPFTGSHDALLSDSETCEVGDILVDQGVAYAKSVSDVITNVTRSTSSSQKSVIGIFVQETPNHVPAPLAKEIVTIVGTGPAATTTSTHIIDPAHDSIVANKTIIVMNSVGEGQVNVCGENGDIEIGDLIVSSSTIGKGMKQDDDIVRSCTVGKAREVVTFASASSTAQIACIYMCG